MDLRIPRETRKKGYHPTVTAPRKLGDRPKSMVFEGFGLLVQLYRAQNRRGWLLFLVSFGFCKQTLYTYEFVSNFDKIQLLRGAAAL